MCKYNMAVRRRVARRRVARKGRKGGRRSRIPRSPQMKNYSYIFRLNPQIISTDGQGYVRIPANTQLGPLKPGTGAPPTGGSIVTYATSTSNFPNCVDWGCAYAPTFGDVANAGNFAAMYDAYKIDRVTVELQYLTTTAITGSAGVASVMPTFWMYFDQDDATVPVDVQNVSRKTGCVKWQPTSSRLTKKFSFKPRVAIAALTALSGNIASVIGKPGQWLDCQQFTTNHYGFKMTCQDFGTPTTGSYNAVRIQYTYHITFRSPLLTN